MNQSSKMKAAKAMFDKYASQIRERHNAAQVERDQFIAKYTPDTGKKEE